MAAVSGGVVHDVYFSRLAERKERECFQGITDAVETPFIFKTQNMCSEMQGSKLLRPFVHTV